MEYKKMTKVEGERPQAPEERTVKVSHLIIGVIWLGTIAVTYIVTSQSQLQSDNKYFNDVMNQATVLRESIK